MRYENLSLKSLVVCTLLIGTIVSSFGQTYATIPFSDDLGTGSFGPHWKVSVKQSMGMQSVVNLSGAWPNYGTCPSSTCQNVGATGGNGVIFYNSSTPVGSNQINLDLHLNLAGKGIVELRQGIVDWGSGWDSVSVMLSNDGGSTFKYATTMKLWLIPFYDGVWNEVTMDLSSLALKTGLPFTSTYVIRYAVFLEKKGSAVNPKSWPNQSVYMDNFKATEISSLPVELMSFTGVNGDSGTALSWETASELNNSHFEVQRSFDGNVWDIIGNVEGNGTTDEVSEYEFFDDNLYGKLLYFRLKQVDFGEGFKYSNVIVFRTDYGFPSMTVVSNGGAPVLSVFNINESVMKIYSVDGKEVYVKNVTNDFVMELISYPRGTILSWCSMTPEESLKN